MTHMLEQQPWQVHTRYSIHIKYLILKHVPVSGQLMFVVISSLTSLLCRIFVIDVFSRVIKQSSSYCTCALQCSPTYIYAIILKVEEKRKADAANGHEIAKILEGKVNRKVTGMLEPFWLSFQSVKVATVEGRVLYKRQQRNTGRNHNLCSLLYTAAASSLPRQKCCHCWYIQARQMRICQTVQQTCRNTSCLHQLPHTCRLQLRCTCYCYCGFFSVNKFTMHIWVHHHVNMKLSH